MKVNYLKQRHIGLSEQDEQKMLKVIGAESVEQLIITLKVFGKIFSSTNTLQTPFFTCSLERKLRIIVTASAAEVASSRREQFAKGSPVRSEIIVWKLNRASKRPWLTSA